MVRSIQRNNSSWHRTPSKLRVSMSNDGETWTYLPSILEKADINKRDFSAFSTDPMFTLVSGIGGYKYVRFEFLATQPHYEFNGHPIGEFSEINLFPVTGIDADNSLTETPSYKVVSAELFNAIQKGHSEFAANAPTQATIDLLKAAIENFGNVSVADSAIAMAKLNMTNLTDGDLIGDFPNDALQTYTTEAGAAIDKYEAAGENRPGEVITTVVNELKTAYDKLYPQMVKPVEGKWYVLNSMNPDVSNWTLAAGGNNGHTQLRRTQAPAHLIPTCARTSRSRRTRTAHGRYSAPARASTSVLKPAAATASTTTCSYSGTNPLLRLNSYRSAKAR